jgi:hypothetical protein
MKALENQDTPAIPTALRTSNFSARQNSIWSLNKELKSEK